MSIKKLFGVSDSERNYLSNKDEKEAFNEDIESSRNLQQITRKQEQNIPHVDYGDPKNFARFGSAYLYYESAINRIIDYYPYDGSDAEINKFHNQSLNIEKYILDNLYPKTNGYININVAGYGSDTPDLDGTSGYGAPQTAYLEYIDFFAGPNTGSGGTTVQQLMPDPHSSKIQSSNIYDEDIYRDAGLPSDYGSGTRTSNLRANFDDGVTVEFWLKTGSLDAGSGILSDKQVVFDMHNKNKIVEADYGRLRISLTSSTTADASGTPFLITVRSGSTGFIDRSLGRNLDSGKLQEWNHYAISFQQSGSSFLYKLYINGGLNDTRVYGGTIGELHPKNMFGRLGALAFDTTTGGKAGSGKLSGSMDEFRFWKVARNGQQIGRYWFTPVHGGVNTDIANTTLGMYYKFNEGITGDHSIDSTVLDYGGRICNGSWTGYTSDSRNINSAIVEAGAAATETKDPIIYAAHPAVSDLKTGLLESGSYHDANNNASFLSLVPGWILDEQDTNETSDLSNIAHIAGAYFDKLYLQMSELPTLRHQNYVSASHKPYTYAKHLPQSLGLYTPDLFIDSKVLEQFANRTDTELFEGNLNEVKNLIYINLYNNLADIFKSKGTEKSIKNVFRCFNIDDKILRVSIESNNNEYILRNNLRQTLINKNCLNLNHKDNVGGVVYSAKRVAESPAGSGYLHSSSLKVGDTYKNEDKYGFTAETNVIFPHFMKSYDKLDRSFKKVSLYGMNMVNTGSTDSKHGTDTTTLAYDKANFQVYAIRDDHNSRNVLFKLTSSLGPGFGVELTSSTFLNVYNNELWNLSVRLKPARYPFAGFVSGAAPTNDNYDLVFSGINTVSTAIANSFTVTASIDSQIARNFLGAAKRLYVGAHRTNVTGALESKSDVLISSAKCWLRYLEDDDLLQHTLDPENAGISGSYQNLSALSWYDTNAEMTKNETLALNWNFLALTGSTTAPGAFNVQDFSSGSTTNRTETGWLGYITGYQNTGRGYGFGSINIDQKEFNAHKFINPEQAVSSDMVQVFSDADELFPNLKKEEIIPNFVYSIEKSLYNAVSEEMLDFFAGAIDFHNIIGSPINRYRGRYKDMEKLRESFFRRVTSLSTVEKYISYYRWFDDALTDIISQLVPASAEFHDGVLNVIESHVLERNKYRSKFPTLDFVIDDLNAEMVGVSERTYPWFYGSSPPPSSPRPTTVREKFWQERALPSADEISASFSDGTAATHVNSQRLKFKNVIYSAPHVSQSIPLVSLPDGTKYPHPSLNRNRFGTPYNFKVSTGNEILKASFAAGTNYSPTKNIQFAPSTFRGVGHVSQENNTFIPLNVLLAKAEDIVPIRDFKEQNIPNDYREKKHRRFKVMYGPDFQSGLTYLNTNTRHAFPFNIMSSTVETGYNINVVRDFMPGVEITNRHPEGWGEENNVGMQGPFTYHNVGGKQVRHIPVNRGTDNWMNRPESDKLLLGGFDCTENGAIGLTDPFYPFPEANDIGVPAYPLSASQPALYYRDFVAQSPVNIKNIKVIAGTHELGNFNYNHEVVSTVGAYANPRQFIENQPELPAQSFQQNAMSATNIRGFWDIHRGTEGHFTWVSDYSTDYLNKTANQTVFSNRYSMPGGIDQQTLGYNDFRSAEYSVYNAVPYRNWSVLKPSQGPSGTLSQPVGSSPSEMRVYDIHGLDYGLWSHEARHTARFGRDSLQVTGTSAATNGPGASYDQPPGWHKINRNNKQRVISCSAGICENQLYDNFFLTHQIPRADRQYSWIGDSVPNSNLIRYNGFQRTDLNRLAPYMSASDGLSYFYDFLSQSNVVVGTDDIAFSGGTQPLNVLNTLTVDALTGAVTEIGTNTLGYPLNSNTTNYLNTALNPNIRSADYLNLLLTKRGTRFWTWKQSRIESHPVLRSEREFNTITALSRSGQALLEGYRLPPVSLKGRPQYINFNSPGISRKKPNNNATLKVTHQNDNIFFNENTLNNVTKMKTCVTPFDQILAVNRGAYWDTRFVVYNQNVFPSMINEFAAWSTGNDRTATYKNNVWNSDPDRRLTLGEEYNAISAGGVTVSQSSWCLDPPGGTSPFDQNYFGRINFLNRGSPMEINSNNETTLKYGGYGGSLQNAKFSYMVGTSVDGTSVSEKFRRMRSLTPGPLGWAKHMIGSPTSVVKMGCQNIPETGSLSGTFDPAEQIDIYAGEASWQSDTPNNAGIVVYNPTTQQAEFQLSASTPWFNTYEEYWQDLKLMAKGYSVLPEFRISDHVEDYLSFGVNNKGLTNWLGFPGVDPLKDPKGAQSIDSSKSNFYQTYTNSDFLKGFLEISQKQLLDAKEIRLTCDAAIRYRPDPSFYPAQRAADLVAQFSRSYGDKITGYFRGEKMSGSALFEENGGCLRPLYEALYSPGILFNSLKAGVACNYPIITDNTQISGTWFGPDLSNAPTPQTNNWALTPSNILDRNDYANTPAGRAKFPQQGFLGNSPFLKLPFETILEPAKYLDGISFYDMQPHPSASLINQYYSNAANPYEGAQTIFGASADEESYTLFARNFLGEIPNIFLKDGTFSSLKSNVVPKDLTFSNTTEGQAGGGYFMRIKIVPPSNGKLGRENEIGSDGTSDAWGRFGARYWDNAGVEGNNSGIIYGFGSGEFNVPQWPMYNPDFKRTQTMCTRPTAYSSIAVAGRASGIWATGNKIAGNKSIPDSFVGCNPLYTPPHADGEAWIDCWFYPSASDGQITEKYDLERILAETKIRTWRFDAGVVTRPGAGPCLISASTAAPKYYDGNMINQVSMQLSASLNYFGVERVYKEERDQNNLVKSKTNETVGSRMVISPKFETPTFNFSDQGIRPISVEAGTLTLPHYASATVNRGIWQQFGVYPTSQQEYPKISIDAPGDSAGGVTQWLKYHYKVVNESSIYNNYDPENANKVATSTKSLAKLLGFDRNNRQMNLGELAENFTLKEAVVAVPYVVRGVVSGSTLDNCAPERRASKKFINIPKTRVQAALKENMGTKAGNSLKEAGMSIRTLADRMEEFVLPPQLDWVHNPNIEPLVMYIFPFEYELDKDDLSYIYQNLAPRDSRKVRMKRTAVAHNLLNQELLSSQNILTTEQLRWMVFKVKQRAKSDYYDHVPDQANVAPSERRDIGAPSLGSGPFKPQLREYPIQYNWPYDYISLVEMARLDVEVLFRPGTQANRENDRKIENKTTERAALDKKRTRKMSSRIGARKKGKGGKY